MKPAIPLYLECPSSRPGSTRDGFRGTLCFILLTLWWASGKVRHGDRCVCDYASSMSTLKDRAHELLVARLGALEGVEEAQERMANARRELADAESSHAQAWEGAVSGGWTPRELRSLGLTEPTKKRPGRPRGTSRTRRATPPAATPSTTDSDITNTDVQAEQAPAAN